LNLQIDKGEFVAIMGSSGSGKSTLLNIIGILDDYDSGSYHLNGKLIKDLSEKNSAVYRNNMLGFVFQSFNLITFKTALENVALPLYYQGIRRNKRNKIAMEYLDRMGLTEWADHLPSELSGGQKQRIAIARALVTNPQVILADEPTGALDSQTSIEVMEILQQVNREGMTIVMVTHDPEMAAMSHKIIKIRDGVIGSIEHQ
ncbi:MAG TPA: ABC transporter ATP-binding protein, partial [Bacteroidales bacterium]|nr:ABC transporter ATP-binding protein [Bacteroidales bacterium]